MEVAPRHKLLTLLTLSTLVYTIDMVYAVNMAYTIDIAKGRGGESLK